MITLFLNGKETMLDASPGEVLLWALRRAGLEGVKCGCRKGQCGACTVLVDGVARPSCLLLAGQVEGRHVLTIEGLGSMEAPHPIQEAFVRAGAVQCGYCTPGMVLSTKALLDTTPGPGPGEVLDALSGNLCRCTGYVKIVEAVLDAARTRAPGTPVPPATEELRRQAR
jgi:aerobic-type carbon monoxide dehydrogenase small subunit (CoxS/CutS family)